jgi:hypothetical protein
VLDVLRALDARDEAVLSRLAAQGFDSAAAAGHVIDIFLRDAFVHGIFHADLHPANLLVLPGNVIGYVDFGITGTLSTTNRRRLARLTLAWSRGDLGELCDTFMELSRETSDALRKAYRRALEEQAVGWYEWVGGQRRLTRSFSLVALEMLAVCHRVGLMPDRSVSRYLRSAIAIDGLVKRFAPDLDVAAQLEEGCRRYLTTLALRDFFSFENAAWWASLPADFLGGSGAPPPGPRGGTAERPPRNDGARALRFAVVSLAFTLHATLAPSGSPDPASLVGALGVSVVAAVLAAGTLVRVR